VIQAIAQLRLAKAQKPLPAGHVMNRLKSEKSIHSVASPCEVYRYE
jgi:hypothetical protein